MLWAVRQRGVIAFISVLVIALVAVTIMVDVAFDHQIDVKRTSRALAEQQAYLLALSTEEYYIDVLFQETKGPFVYNTIQNTVPYDGLDENWAIALPFLPVDNGNISAQLIDLHSKVNINNLTLIDNWQQSTKLDDAFKVSPQANALLWGFLFTDMINGSLEIPLYPPVMPALVDWFDTDLSERVDGAEDLFYLQPDYNYRVANNSFYDISELNLIKDIDSTLIEPIKDLLSVVPLPTVKADDGNQIRLNINTISDLRILSWLALVASSAPLSKEQLDLEAVRIIENRPYTEVDQFIDVIMPPLIDSDPTIAVENQRNAIKSMVTVTSQYFLLITQAELGDITIEVKSWIRRDKAGRNFTVFRREMKRRAQYVPPPPKAVERDEDDDEI